MDIHKTPKVYSIHDGDLPSSPDKFSNIENVTEEDKKLYVELEKFVYYLAWGSSNPNNILMEAEEIVGELLEELVKGMKHYPNLPHLEKVKVLKTMLDHRMGELKYRFYGTHRKAAILNVSLEQDLTSDNDETGDDIVANDELGVEEAHASKERVALTRALLSSNSKRVFDAVVFGNKRLEDIMRLSAIRSTTVYANPIMSLKCWQVAEALVLTNAQVEQAFTEIREAYTEVCNACD
jgi:hypothetical protein